MMRQSQLAVSGNSLESVDFAGPAWLTSGVDGIIGDIQQAFDRVAGFLGYDGLAWLLLVLVLALRPPVLAGFVHLRRIRHAGRYRHLTNLSRFHIALTARTGTAIGRRPS